MKYTHLAAALAVLAAFTATTVSAQEISIPKKPSQNEMLAKAIAYHGGRPKRGYVGLPSAILVPLDETASAVMYGMILGKRKGDSYHYFENEDLGIVCGGTGHPAKSGGVVENTCYLNGEMISHEVSQVAQYGKVSGTYFFDSTYKGETVGRAIMKWGLSFPKPKKLVKLLEAEG